MIRHIFSTLCNKSSIDKETNSMSIFNIIEQITIFTEKDTTIQLPMQFEIISHWMRSIENRQCEGKAKIFICDPKGISRSNIEIKIDLTNNLFARTIIKAPGLEIRGPGKYEVHVELLQESGQFQEMTSIPFQVTYKKPEIKEMETNEDNS